MITGKTFVASSSQREELLFSDLRQLLDGQQFRVHDLDVFGAARRPAEAHTKLIVDSDAVLAGSISFER